MSALLTTSCLRNSFSLDKLGIVSVTFNAMRWGIRDYRCRSLGQHSSRGNKHIVRRAIHLREHLKTTNMRTSDTM